MKLKITLLCLSIFLGTIFQQAFCQNLSFTGKVINQATGEPLPGATVTVNGTKTQTSTDAGGNFTIPVEKGKRLTITYIGMLPVSIQVSKIESVACFKFYE